MIHFHLIPGTKLLRQHTNPEHNPAASAAIEQPATSGHLPAAAAVPTVPVQPSLTAANAGANHPQLPWIQ